MLRYVDEADLSHGTKRFVRLAAPLAAIFVPAAFFLSLPSPTATHGQRFIYLAYVGAVILARASSRWASASSGRPADPARPE